MIISTTEELRLYIPTHVIENIHSLAGFMDNSEHDFLLDKIGKPLYDRMMKEYDTITDKQILMPENRAEQNAWHKLIQLCQRPVAFDMLYRTADVSALSINDSGINIVATDNNDAASKDVIERYKTRCNIEAHRGIDRLLVQLEEWAQTPDEGAESNEEKTIRKEIVDLWKKSSHYYLADGLFVNTATKFNEFIDIYESREKFIQLLPDLRYCQEIIIRPELGDELTDQLLKGCQNGTLEPIQQQAVYRIQRALTTHVEARNKQFTRKEAKDEAILLTKRMVEFIKKHQSEMPDGVKEAPFYEPEKEADVNPKADVPKTEKWKNNRRGNKLFVISAIE